MSQTNHEFCGSHNGLSQPISLPANLNSGQLFSEYGSRFTRLEQTFRFFSKIYFKPHLLPPYTPPTRRNPYASTTPGSPNDNDFG
jgi:hypothetical protein